MNNSPEYILTNGLGGYSFNTVENIPTRKYHALYTISKTPPVDRFHLISTMEAALITMNGRFPLHHPTSFNYDGTAKHTYSADGADVLCESAFEKGSNLFVMSYRIDSPFPCQLTLEPLFNFRDHHSVSEPRSEEYTINCHEACQTLEIISQDISVFIRCDGTFLPFVQTGYSTFYEMEAQRGYDNTESQLSAGAFSIDVPAGQSVFSCQINIVPAFREAHDVLLEARQRAAGLIDAAGFKNPVIQQLVLSSDDFIVKRSYPDKTSIIAGYPWFNDWGRDTMIALPGLTLTTKRYAEAIEIIEGFLENTYKGLIPNTYPDFGQPLLYNTADATLWLFNALHAYYQRTADKEKVGMLMPQLQNILKHHMEGTINFIFMDHDGLLSTGDMSTQLTWMDVKVNGWVATPRYGKVVEINALWYNAICIMLYFMDELNLDDDFYAALTEIKLNIYEAFNAKFLHPDADRLYDMLIDDQGIDIPRPNMILSVSLPYPVLRPQLRSSIVDYVTNHFKTPYGLLTLRPEDENYHGTYTGNVLSRDSAYHRGTAWAWLMGPYLEAHFKTYNDRDYVDKALDELLTHLDEGLLGSISEIFDGDAPHLFRGCPAQAWSVGEVLRIYDLLHHDDSIPSRSL